MRFGYTLLTEQAGPRELVRCAARAEETGFDFEVMSDHYSPWLAEQAHAPYAWSVLGAITERTSAIELMTYVTCPTMRYHPAVVAQKAATIQLLSGGRFSLGLGAGENLNEHVAIDAWPPVNVRHDMLAEAMQIINGLFDGGHFDYEGEHFRVDSAKLWDLPARRVPIGVAVSGKQSVRRFAPVANTMIAVQPDQALTHAWDDEWHATNGGAARKVGQVPLCYDTDKAAAISRAREQFRWFAGGWKVNAELPGTDAFAAATQFVTESDVAAGIPCGPDIEPIVDSVRPFADAGFTDIALVQIGGGEQDGFLDFAGSKLLPALRERF